MRTGLFRCQKAGFKLQKEIDLETITFSMFGLGWRQVRWLSGQSKLSKLRNIGIIAHIDAGKTTTTERMLYYSGKTDRIGNVDQGDTITDYLPQERERGITIQSAVISFNWQKDHRINLIDTPGHVDFTFEVTRSLKVLDGCVTILDAVAGVEPQTEKVWKQAKSIPKICYVNKMDRVGAGYSRTVKELITKLHQRVVLVNMPIFKFTSPSKSDKQFEGVLDVINKTIIRWDGADPDKIDVQQIGEEETEYFEQLKKARESMIETLGEFDEELIEYFLEHADGDYLKLPASKLNDSIRKATLANYVTPILCGSSFKNVGVQPLLDAVVNYLPSPLDARLPDKNVDVPMVADDKLGLLINNNKNLSVSLAFKVITDPVRGVMVFVRVYSGNLKNGNYIHNTNTGNKFKINKPVIMHANVPEDVQLLNAGEIGVLTGSSVLNNIETGDTLVSHLIKKDGIKSLDKEKELLLKINPITIPTPVISVTIQPRTLGNRKYMDEALKILTREDPSLHVTYDDESGETLLSGMGELHLEIAKHKLVNELRADVEIGKLMVSFKETLKEPTPIEHYETDTGYNFNLQVEPVLNSEIESLESSNKNDLVYSLGIENNFLIIEDCRNLKAISENWDKPLSFDTIINSIIPSCLAGLQKGGKIASFPLFSCAVRLKKDWTIPQDVNNSSEIMTIVRQMILDSLNSSSQSNYCVLEPVMNLEITTTQNSIGNVVQDLTGVREATILSVDDEAVNGEASDDSRYNFYEIAKSQYLPYDESLNLARLDDDKSGMKSIKAIAPLRNMTSYNSCLRSLTQGRGSFFMSYNGMEKVTNENLGSVINQ